MLFYYYFFPGERDEHLSGMDNTIGFKIPHSIQKNKTFCLKRMLITIGTVRQKQKITRKTYETVYNSCSLLRLFALM